MTDNETKKPQPRKVRGVATFHDDDSVEFSPYREGVPVQKGVRKRGESRFYETDGEKTSSYIAHLKVPKDSTDPAAEMMEQLQYFLKPLAKKELPAPKNKALLDKPGVRVWHRKSENKIVVMMEITPTETGELSYQLFNLTAEVNKCFAINETFLLPPKK